MRKERKKVETVEELDNFPYKSFQEFKQEMGQGVAGLGVDRGMALNWSYKGIYSPTSVRFKATFFALLPFLAVIGFVAYIVLTGSWLMLLWLPVIAILFFVFHPSAGMMFGPIRTLLIWGMFIGLAYALFTETAWLLALTLTLAVIWYAEKAVYKNAVNGLIQAASTHEDLLCLMWQAGVANISYFNGNMFWVDHKSENGEYTHYDD